MKIKSIIIENFKGIAKKSVNFEDGKIFVLSGPNGMGKTSFIEALRYGLTGALPQNPIRDGAEYASVTIITEDGTKFSRTIFRDNRPSKVNVNGRTTPAKNLNALIKEIFGFGTDILKIATSSEVIASMQSDELGDFLLQYIPEKLNIAKVLSVISDLSIEMKEAITLALPEEDFDIKELETAYEQFLNMRKSTKKDLDFFKSKLIRLPEEKPLKSVAELQKSLELVISQEGEAKASHEAAKLYKDAVQRREAALKNIKELRDKFETITAMRPNPDVRESMSKKLDEWQATLSDAINMKNIMANTIKTLNATLTRLSTNHCPLSDSLICTTDKTQAKDELIAAIQSNEEGLRIQNKKIDEATCEINNLRNAILEYDTNATLYKEKILIGEQLARAEKNIPTLPSTPITEIEVTNFEREKNIVKAQLEYATKWEERVALEAKIKEAENAAYLYDKLCKAFAPKGEIATAILSSYLSIFEEELNARASLFKVGMSVKFLPENGVKFLAKMKEESDFHLYEELSDGEKTLASFMLLDLVSSLCGTKISIVDNLNNLDNGNLDELLSFVTSPEFLGQYDNAIISSVDNDNFTHSASKYASVIQH